MISNKAGGREKLINPDSSGNKKVAVKHYREEFAALKLLQQLPMLLLQVLKFHVMMQ